MATQPEIQNQGRTKTLLLRPGEREARSIRTRVCRVAVNVALTQGVLDKNWPVLDLGCGDPFSGMFRALYDLGWRGLYVGVDHQFPRSAVRQYRERLEGRDAPLDGCEVVLHQAPIDLQEGQVLPFPPTAQDPEKKFGVAFLVDVCRRIRNGERLFWDAKRVAAQVVATGGVTFDDLNLWDCQNIADHQIYEDPESVGVWMDLRAEARYRIVKAHPQTTMGVFGTLQDGREVAVPQMLGVCQNCGTPDTTKRSRFKCKKCGRENRVRPPNR